MALDEGTGTRRTPPPKRNPPKKKNPPKRPTAADRQATRWGADVALFVPPALVSAPPIRGEAPGEKVPRVVPQAPRGKLPTKAQREATERAARVARNWAAIKAPVGLEPRLRVRATESEEERKARTAVQRSKPPESLISRLADLPTLADVMKATPKAAPAFGGAIAEMARPVSSLLVPSASGLDPRRGGDVRTPAELGRKYEEAGDVVLGKSLTNLIAHGDRPNTWMQGAGLAAGVLGVTPFGKVGQAAKAVKTAAKAADAERIYVNAAKAVAKTNTPEEITALRAPIQEQMNTHVEAVKAIQAGEQTKESAKALKQHIDEIQSLHVHDQILGRAVGEVPSSFQGWAPKQTVARVQSKLNPKNIAKGVAYKNPTIFNKAGIHVAGPVTPEQWVEKIMAAFPTLEERQHWSTWYDHFAPAFREQFGELADDLMRGFAVSQANNSPVGGMRVTLKVLDRLQRGDSVETISHLGIGTRLMVKTVAKAVTGTDGKIDQGVAAKLSDFIDSFLKKDTRTWMGDHPLGGKPSAVDVHALRDVGLIDKKLVGKLEAVHGLKLGEDFVVDSTGGASGPLYERVSEMYTRFAEHLNEIRFDGRTDWLPSEAQALGWGATQKTHGVDPDDLMAAFRGNTQSITFEVTRGPLGLGNDLSPAQTRRIANAMKQHVRALVEDTPRIFLRNVKVGVGGWAQGTNINITVDVIGSAEAVQAALTRFAKAFDQEWVQATREVTSKKAQATLLLDSPKFKNPKTRARFFQALNRIEPKLEGFMDYDVDGVPALAIRTDSRSVSPKNADKFKARYQAAIEQAEAETGIAVNGSVRNMEMLTGGQHGEVAPIQTLAGSGGGLGRGALDDPLAARIRADLEAEIARVQGSFLGPRGPVSRLAREETGTLSFGAGFRRGEPPPATVAEAPPVAGQHYEVTRHSKESVEESVARGQGAYFTIKGSSQFQTARPGEATVEMTVHPRNPLLVDKPHKLQSAGEAALLHFEPDLASMVDNVDVDGLVAWGKKNRLLTPKELAFIKEDGSIYIVTDMLGGKIARRKGHDAIVAYAPGKTDGEYVALTPSGVKSTVEQIREAIPSAKPIREAQEAGYSVERGARLEEAMHQLEMQGGVAGQAAAAKALAGELPKLEWGGFEFLDETSFGAMIDHVTQHAELRDWEKIRTIWALKRAMNKVTPTRSEIDLLERAFGKQVADNFADPVNSGLMAFLYRLGLDVWNTPRTLMATFDLSAPFRQGLVAGARHPVLFTKNFLPMVKALGPERVHLEVMDDIVNRANFDRMQKAKLALQDVAGSGAMREEQFPGSLAERTPLLKIPVGSASRAYSTFLNKLRADIFDQMIEVASANGKVDIDDPEFLKALGNYINTTTGRGRLPGEAAEKAAPFLNAFLFSPRLLASRFNILLNPVYYTRLYRQSPFVFWQQMRATAQTLGGISTTLLLASQIPGVSVNMNPTSANFGKIRIGNMRWDIMGGFQPMFILVMREILGRTTSATSGENRPFGGFGGSNRWEVMQRFFEGKMAPTPGLIRDLLSDQKTFIGEPLTLKGVALNSLIPLNVQGGIEGWQGNEENKLALALASGALGSIGFGAGSYPDESASKKGGGGRMPMPGGGGSSDSGRGGRMPMPP